MVHKSTIYLPGGGGTGTPNSLSGFDNTGVSANVTIGSGLVLTGNVLSATGGGGSVTFVSVISAAGVSGTVNNPSTTPAITISLGDITPSSVNATGLILGSNLAGTNTGDNVSATTPTTFTQGSIIFAGPSTLSQNNTDLFWDNSNNRLGVLTSLPQTTFDIGGLITTNIALTSAIVNVSANLNGISGFEMRNTSLGTSADFRFAISDTTGASFNFSVPGVNCTTSSLFGLARKTTNYIFTSNDNRALGIGTLASTSLVLATGGSAAITIAGSTQISTFSNNIIVQGTVAGTSFLTTSTLNNFVNQSVSSVTNSLTAGTLQFAGSTNVAARTIFGLGANATITANNNYGSVIFGSVPIQTPATGTHNFLANVVINGLGIVTSGGATVTNTASLYVGPASTAGSTNYALYAAGSSAIAGNLILSNTLFLNGYTGTGNRAIYVTSTGQATATTGFVSSTSFAATAGVTVGNTTATTSVIPTGVGSVTIPANGFKVGKSYLLKGRGVYSASITAPTLAVTVKLGTTTVATGTITALLGSASNSGFSFEMMITCRTVGASGTIMADGSFAFQSTAAQGVGALYLNNSTSTVTIDTTTSQLLDVQIAWSAASASNTLTVNEVTLQSLGE